jgi:hypothetical protein
MIVKMLTHHARDGDTLVELAHLQRGWSLSGREGLGRGDGSVKNYAPDAGFGCTGQCVECSINSAREVA